MYIATMPRSSMGIARWREDLRAGQEVDHQRGLVVAQHAEVRPAPAQRDVDVAGDDLQVADAAHCSSS